MALERRLDEPIEGEEDITHVEIGGDIGGGEEDIESDDTRVEDEIDEADIGVEDDIGEADIGVESDIEPVNDIEDTTRVESEDDGEAEAEANSGQPDDDFDDFDDFEEFEEFETAETAETEPPFTEPPTEPPTEQQQQQRVTQFPCLSESDFSNSAQLQASVRSTLKQMWSNEQALPPALTTPNLLPRNVFIERTPTPSPDRSSSVYHLTEPGSYFSERSASLWQQLVVDGPHVNPIDWKKSSIRRLLLVSLGIPLDLDEILPNKSTKRLVLPMSTTRRVSEGDKKGTSTSTTGAAGTSHSRAKKSDHDKEALRQETEIKVSSWHQLSIVSTEALEGMNESELETHVDTLKTALIEAQGVSAQWQELLQSALQDKETFEGVIESLLEYAQRLRTRSK